MRLAIMQPCWAPYAGYFRLFDVDLFVFLDDSQYVDRSYINRNRLTTLDDKVDWLSLPLKRKPRDTAIKDIEFADAAREAWEVHTRRFKVFKKETLLTSMAKAAASFQRPVRAIEVVLERAREELGIRTPITRTSSFAERLPPGLKGQDRILAICNYFNTTEYINAPGGMGLYKPETFKKRGINLKILKPYEGSALSILERLTFEDPKSVRKEIVCNNEFIS